MNTLALPKLLDKVFNSLVGISSLRAERSCLLFYADMVVGVVTSGCVTLGLKSGSLGSKSWN